MHGSAKAKQQQCSIDWKIAWTTQSVSREAGDVSAMQGSTGFTEESVGVTECSRSKAQRKNQQCSIDWKIAWKKVHDALMICGKTSAVEH
eukprot:11179558-Lingulodinium_polyedra.AAC.2